MAQMRLIGTPEEIDTVLELLNTVARVSDVSRGTSRRNAAHILTYAHIEPLLPAEKPRRRVPRSTSAEPEN